MPILGIMASAISGNLATASYESIATVTTTSTQATISFTSIPATYKHLQLRILSRNDDAAGGINFMRLKLNSDATSGNYRGHYLYGSGGSVSSAAVAGATSGLPIGEVAGNTNTANCFAATVLDILDYANTTNNKTTRGLTGADFNTTSGGILLVSGLYMSTSAISRIDIVSSVGTGFITNSSFALYGIKG